MRNSNMIIPICRDLLTTEPEDSKYYDTCCTSSSSSSTCLRTGHPRGVSAAHVGRSVRLTYVTLVSLVYVLLNPNLQREPMTYKSSVLGPHMRSNCKQ